MTIQDWQEQIVVWRGTFELETRPPIGDRERTESPNILADLPDDFKSLYEVTNGLRSVWFNLLPVAPGANIKHDWDSLNRANDPEHTRFLEGDEELLAQFIVFAEMSGGCCACLDRNDGSIWFEDDEGIHQTDLDLRDFIETTLQEVRDL